MEQMDKILAAAMSLLRFSSAHCSMLYRMNTLIITLLGLNSSNWKTLDTQGANIATAKVADAIKASQGFVDIPQAAMHKMAACLCCLCRHKQHHCNTRWHHSSTGSCWLSSCEHCSVAHISYIASHFLSVRLCTPLMVHACRSIGQVLPSLPHSSRMSHRPLRHQQLASSINTCALQAWCTIVTLTIALTTYIAMVPCTFSLCTRFLNLRGPDNLLLDSMVTWT